MTASGGGAVILNFLCFLCRLEAGDLWGTLEFPHGIDIISIYRCAAYGIEVSFESPSTVSMCGVRLRPWPEPVEVLYFACVGMAAGSKIER